MAGVPASVAAGVTQEAVGPARGTATVPLKLPAPATLADQVQHAVGGAARPMSQVTLVVAAADQLRLRAYRHPARRQDQVDAQAQAATAAAGRRAATGGRRGKEPRAADIHKIPGPCPSAASSEMIWPVCIEKCSTT